jgi:hypothetical protein
VIHYCSQLGRSVTDVLAQLGHLVINVGIPIDSGDLGQEVGL